MSDKIKKIGVIGAGQMGSGIAHVCALSGRAVYMLDVSDDALARGMDTIERGMSRQVERDLISADDMKNALTLIKTG
ncbi:MAG TPA: 3-hydroxybutyryl-CoA dehydrogenase, partial [Rhodospirillaceae bacterium]|nr:3-hydroxybutyryl-CoA dehydrogenase [Rhodospirillaceae bacterium]